MRAKSREEAREKARGVREKGGGVRSARSLPRERRKEAATGWSKEAATQPRCFMDHLIHGRWQVLHLYDSLCHCVCPPLGETERQRETERDRVSTAST